MCEQQFFFLLQNISKLIPLVPPRQWCQNVRLFYFPKKENYNVNLGLLDLQGTFIVCEGTSFKIQTKKEILSKKKSSSSI